MALIQSHRTGNSAPEDEDEDARHLAEKLLNVFGWERSDDAREKPLAGCLRIGGNGQLIVAENVRGNDLRIVLESFCKDLVDLVVALLGYNHTEVWSAIGERIPAYRPSSRRLRDWDEEVRRLTVAGGVMLFSALAPLAFPERADAITDFAACLQRLSRLLNEASHHREGKPDSSTTLNETPQLVRQLLEKAEKFLGELPWHLEASLVYGEQPKVLSGEAWSHGSAAPRLLRVIDWAGAAPGKELTIWSKTCRNPIVTDPVFVVRPRRS